MKGEMEELVWIPSITEAYVLGKIVDIQADSATVQIEESKIKLTVPYGSLMPADDPSRPDVDDNCSLFFLNEASLLENIRRRYFNEKVYTYVGNILITVNPYKQIDKLYDYACIKAYNNQSLGRMPPHVFAIADHAHRSLAGQKISQAIIVSGESGAGKTECTKHILRYLTENWGTRAGPVEQLILNSNPLLEAFGNAKTRRNNNSSRFGKFIELHFSKSNQVAGAHISHYLLEKSRICLQSDDERNYHIFYQMCAGFTDPELRRELALGEPSEFNYLRGGCSKYFRRSSSVIVSEVVNRNKVMYLRDDLLDDAADFARTKVTIDELGLEKEQNDIFRILSAILHLGNVEFAENDRDRKGGCVVDEKTSGKSISIAAKFLGVEKTALSLALTTRIMMGNEGAKGTACSVQLSSTAARNARDALAKSIYSRLFDFIVEAVNGSLPFDQSSASQFIGVLDIAGFEFFDVNSFEQFCVNYCNERLQQFFTFRILKAEQRLYEQEGLAFRRINFIDNEDCIELLDAKPDGIFCLMDEESKFPKPSAEHFTQEVHRKNANHFRLFAPRKSKLKTHKEIRDEEGFVIRHYAGAVCYTTAGFLEKNNDSLHASLEGLVQSSSNALLRRLFMNDQEQFVNNGGSHKTNKQSNKLSFVSISAKFRGQLQVLLGKLEATGTHFIRCMKPNSEMKPKQFEGASVLSQLQASGMTEALRLMQQGYPSRVVFNDFYQLYKERLPANLAKLDPRLFCRALCKAVGMADSDFTFGTTKVFFRSGRFAEFDQVMRTDCENLRKLIENVQRWLIRARWRKAQFYILSAVRFRIRMSVRLQKATVIQRMVRGHLVRLKILPLMCLLVLRRRLTQDVASSIKQLKGESRKQADVELAGFAKSIEQQAFIVESKESRLDRKQVETIVVTKTVELEQFIQNVQKRLSDQNARDAELERLRRLEAEMAEAKRKREAEEAETKRREEAQRAEEEAARKIVLAAAEADAQRVLAAAAEGKRTEEEDTRLAKTLQEQVDCRDEGAQMQIVKMQEKLDKDLALRMANGKQDDVMPLSPAIVVETDKKSAATGRTKRKYDLSNWKYAELRDAINTSCDLELIEECRQEFHRRLRIYHEWKMRNRGRDENAISTAQERMPGSVMHHALQEQQSHSQNDDKAVNTKQFNTPLTILPPTSTQKMLADQRYFRLPLKHLGPRGTTYTAGWWLAHFDGQWIARQLEIRDNTHPVLKLAGIDDMSMCEFSLSETGLEGRPEVEISEQHFEHEWNRNYGFEYLISNAGSVSSPYLKDKFQKMMLTKQPMHYPQPSFFSNSPKSKPRHFRF